MSRSRKYSKELIERGVRVVFESGRPVKHVADDLGVRAETLRRYVRRAEADSRLRSDLPASEEIRQLRKENFELRRANEILKSASVFFAKEIDSDRCK